MMQKKTFSTIIVFFCKIPSPFSIYVCINVYQLTVYFLRKHSISTTPWFFPQKINRNLTYRTYDFCRGEEIIYTKPTLTCTCI